MLGSAVVRELQARGHEAVVTSRTAGPGKVVVDLASGKGLAEAVAGADAIVHAASDPGAKARDTDVAGTRNIALTGLPVLYVSIVGVERHPFRYYRIKHEGQDVLAANSQAWTVLQSTQFHGFIDKLLTLSKSAAGKLPGNRDTSTTRFPATQGFQFQPIAHEEVASKIVTLVENGPTNSIAQIGGPQVLDSGDLTRSWVQVRGGRPVFVPTAGRIARAFKDGVVLTSPGADLGTQTWETYLNRPEVTR